ncbi:hypothetical protein, partial [Bifidobacterium choerinum]|uniref:hypothetical protein n=1 Tax=Bifidobacterium choerinum TaxID=35760 RepID=UPI0019D3D4EB
SSAETPMMAIRFLLPGSVVFLVPFMSSFVTSPFSRHRSLSHGPRRMPGRSCWQPIMPRSVRIQPSIAVHRQYAEHDRSHLHRTVCRPAS